MKRIASLLVVVATLAGIAVFTVTTSRHVTAQEPAPIFVKKIPPGYRDWKVVSVAHEAGDLNDIRAVLGNDTAIKAYREGKFVCGPATCGRVGERLDDLHLLDNRAGPAVRDDHRQGIFR